MHDLIQAIRLVHEQSNKYRQFLRELAAIVLLGTPHSSNSLDWKSFANVLYSGSGTQKKRVMTDEEMHMLAESSAMFERAGVLTPLISVYETQKTKVRMTLGFSQKLMVSQPQLQTLSLCREAHTSEASRGEVCHHQI